MSSDSEEGGKSASAADAATTGYSDWEGLTWGPTKTNPGLKQGANSRGIKALALAHFNWAEGQEHRINTIARLKQWEDDSPALKGQAAETLTVEQLIVRLEQESLGGIPASPSTQEEKDARKRLRDHQVSLHRRMLATIASLDEDEEEESDKPISNEGGGMKMEQQESDSMHPSPRASPPTTPLAGAMGTNNGEVNTVSFEKPQDEQRISPPRSQRDL